MAAALAKAWLLCERLDLLPDNFPPFEWTDIPAAPREPPLGWDASVCGAVLLRPVNSFGVAVLLRAIVVDSPARSPPAMRWPLLVAQAGRSRACLC